MMSEVTLPLRVRLCIVENSTRIMVDGEDIRVAFSKDLQSEPLRVEIWLWHGYMVLYCDTLSQYVVLCVCMRSFRAESVYRARM